MVRLHLFSDNNENELKKGRKTATLYSLSNYQASGFEGGGYLGFKYVAMGLAN